ncbi:hypothetical protein ABZ468_53310 [Streptomyces sp. NPDC005708]|uniref:hypothetical protein n=1 Tax=Streptomyces sp. NPDC005708 TaxID=3154564 RepID=UPI0034065989
MAAPTTNLVPLTGLRYDSLLTPAAGGGDCAPGAGVLLILKNANTTSKTVTLAVPALVDGDLTISPRQVVVSNAAETAIPITDRCRNPSTGRCAVTDSVVTSVSVAVVRVATS